jgi:hypothetical protein
MKMALPRDEDAARIMADIKDVPKSSLPYYIQGFKDGATWDCDKWANAFKLGKKGCCGATTGHSYPPCTGECCQGT